MKPDESLLYSICRPARNAVPKGIEWLKKILPWWPIILAHLRLFQLGAIEFIHHPPG